MASSARIDELKKKFDENPRRYFAPLANEYRKAGDSDQAIAICREFLPQQPGHMSGHIVYGQALYDAQQYEEARTVFDTALTLDPENLIALRSLGDIARNLGDPGAARAWYQRVLDADPRNADAAAALAALSEAAAAPAPEAPPVAAAEPAAPPAATAPTEPAAEAAEPAPRMSEMLILGATPLDEPPAAGDTVQAPEAAGAVIADEPLEGIVTGSAAALALPPAEPAAPVEVLETAPRETPAPPAEELLDLGDLGIEAETPVVPRISTPRTTLSAMGVELDRSDDESYLPTLHQEAPAAAEAAEPAPEERVPTVEQAASAPEPPAAHDPFATETMAELYLSQGHPEEAIRVYRQLIAQRGGDAGLEARIARIEAMTALTPAIPMAAIPEPPAAEPEPEAEPAAETPQRVPDLDVSGFSFETSTPPPASAVEPAPEPEPVPEPATSGPSIREFLSRFARRVPTPAGAPGTAGEGEPFAEQEMVMETAVAEAVEVVDVIDVVDAPKTQLAAPGGGGSIDALFGDGQVATAEESAAATLAGAYGVSAPEPSAPTIAGAPARRATEELSLDNVFRDPQTPPRGEPAGFSFDQFFAGGTPARGAAPVQETPAQSQPSESADSDIEQFNSWLEGLKKR